MFSEPFEYFRLHQHRPGTDPIDIDSPNLATLTVVTDALRTAHPDDPAPVITGINTVDGTPRATFIDATLNNVLCAQDDDTAVVFEITRQTQHRIKVPVEIADDRDAVDAFLKTAVNADIGVNSRHLSYYPVTTSPNKDASEETPQNSPVAVTVNNPDGEPYFFNGRNEDELWSDIREYFEGAWEGDYASVHDYIEELGWRYI